MSHRVLVIMDKFTRRIIGFGVLAGDVDGIALCQLFNAAISTRVFRTTPVLTMTHYSDTSLNPGIFRGYLLAICALPYSQYMANAISMI
jgi:hypothetical protein